MILITGLLRNKNLNSFNDDRPFICNWKLHFPKGHRTRFYFTKFFDKDDELSCIHSMVTLSVKGEVLTLFCRDLPPGCGDVRVHETQVEVDAVISPKQWMDSSGFVLKYEPY